MLLLQILVVEAPFILVATLVLILIKTSADRDRR
jgi:hypothetical protein